MQGSGGRIFLSVFFFYFPPEGIKSKAAEILHYLKSIASINDVRQDYKTQSRESSSRAEQDKQFLLPPPLPVHDSRTIINLLVSFFLICVSELGHLKAGQ